MALYIAGGLVVLSVGVLGILIVDLWWRNGR